MIGRRRWPWMCSGPETECAHKSHTGYGPPEEPVARDTLGPPWATLSASRVAVGLQVDPKPKSWIAAVSSRLGEPFDQLAAIRNDYALRGDVVGFRRQLDVIESRVAELGQKECERPGCVSTSLLPRHHRIADVA